MNNNLLDSVQDFRVGQTVIGTVYSINAKENSALVTYGDFTEGKIYLDNITTDKNIEFIAKILKKGDEIQAVITKRDADRGQILLSCLPLLAENDWVELKKKFVQKEIIEVKITKILPSGCVAYFKSQEVFIPRSQIGFDIVKTIKVNDIVEVEILDLKDEEDFRKVVCGRREIAESKREQEQKNQEIRRQEQLNSLKIGDLVEAEIIKVNPLSALAKVTQDLVGLVRISQVSHIPVESVSSVLKEGQKVTLKVISKEKGKLDLSYKATFATPFQTYIAANEVGATVKGKITKGIQFGLIVELAKGVSGLLHKSEYSHNPNDNFEAYHPIGSEIELKIIKIDQKNERISLSKKVLLDNPWSRVKAKVGDTVEVEIKEIKPFNGGLIVEMGEVTGFISYIESGLKTGQAQDEYFQVGEKVQAIVTYLNPLKWELSLSISKLNKINSDLETKKLVEEANKEAEGQVFTIGDLLGK